MGSKLYVGNLDFQVTSDHLRDLFTGAGHVVSARVITDRATDRSKGFGFVEMATEAEALNAISHYDGFKLYGQAMVVSVARPREARPKREPQPNVRAQFKPVRHARRGGAQRRVY